ncbi:MAG TPA: TetR/AcrR family transcriptional regulator [Solirubrobacteraceae bacterium]|nr:TetR/AcrR family transcriptional regulator [Solirubrobacteraceae bacterium]
MSPRKYDMTKRAEALEATRTRIVEATVAAHRELGIQATSWDEIASRAEVGVGTVYRHFRSLDELLPACGAVVTEALALPAADEIPGLLDGAGSLRERIRRIVTRIFAAYERGAPFIENIRRERAELPALEPWHQQIENTLDALSNEALRPISPDKHALDLTRALADLYTWKAFKQRGLSHQDMVETVTGLIARAVTERPKRT